MICAGSCTCLPKQLLTALIDKMPAGFSRQIDNHVVPVLNQPGALLNQQVGTPTQLGGDVSRDGKDLAALIHRQFSSDCRSAVLRAFNYQNAEAHTTNDAVA